MQRVRETSQPHTCAPHFFIIKPLTEILFGSLKISVAEKKQNNKVRTAFSLALSYLNKLTIADEGPNANSSWLLKRWSSFMRH